MKNNLYLVELYLVSLYNFIDRTLSAVTQLKYTAASPVNLATTSGKKTCFSTSQIKTMLATINESVGQQTVLLQFLTISKIRMRQKLIEKPDIYKEIFTMNLQTRFSMHYASN